MPTTIKPGDVFAAKLADGRYTFCERWDRVS
jgi:hypothetical protein